MINVLTRFVWLTLEFYILFLLDYYYMNLPVVSSLIVTALLVSTHVKSFMIGAKAGYIKAHMEIVANAIEVLRTRGSKAK